MRKYWTITCLLWLGTFYQAFAQVTVDFTVSNTTGCGTVNAQFTDLSTSTNGAIVSWNWNFGGASYTNQNPGHFFTVPGTYTVCLTVTDSQGAQGNLCKDDFVTVFALPNPDFVALPESGCNPLTVTFQDNSTSNDGTIQQWTWGLGGSSGVIINSAADDVSTIYSLPETYSVSLTVEDDNGCFNTITKTDYILVETPPNIAFSALETFSCYPPLITTFTNDNIEPGISYKWDFGNGTTFSGTTPPPITYNQTGQYDVTLIAETGMGCADTLTLEDYISVGEPASFTFDPENGCADLVVQFTDTSPSPADSVWWSFGDGTTSTTFDPSHTYTAQGCYNISFIRYTNGGCITSVNSQNCIQVYPKPQATIQVDEPMGCDLPHAVQFSANQSGLTDWYWDFGDGNTSTDPSPSHTYTSLGSFPVSLVVTNLFGCTATMPSETVTVFDYESQLTSGNLYGCTPLTANLSSSNNSLVPVVDWQWEVTNDGASPPVQVTGSGENPSLILVDTGLYDIQLITINELGCADTVEYQNQAGVGLPPIVDFSATPDTACVNDDITFTDGSSSFANEWLWNFGDGGVSAEQNPVYHYEDVGPFDVTLQAFHHGCESELIKPEFIFINFPKANFSVEMSCINYFLVSVQDESTGATSILYDFGVPGIETDTTSEPNPQYLYPDEGTYTITQMVENDTTGCVDTMRVEVTVGVPLANFSVYPITGCAPLTVQVADSSNFATSYAYELLSGQGTISGDATDQPSILFTDPGVYTGIKLLITDLNGCQDSIVLDDSIYVNSVTPDFTVDPVAGCAPLSVNLTDQSSSLFATVDQWEWTISDIPDGPFVEANLSYTFTNIGTYDVNLVVTDDWGCSATLQLDDAVYVTLPAAEFEADTLGCTQSLVDFTSLSQGDGLIYSWEFGDGNTSTEQNPAHQYQQEGTYSVCLTVTDVNDCQHNICKADYVVIADPVAAFTADETYAACPPLLVNFENNSINASSYLWDFGDSSGSSELEDPPHVYTFPGNYDVTLIAISTFKCQDTLVLDDFINIEGPVGSFQFDKDTICIPDNITFTAESNELYNYFWDFGDGTLDTTLNVVADTLMHNYQEPGRFAPKLILEDLVGCRVTYESPDSITTSTMNTDFIALDTALCEGESGTTFINLTESSHPILFREWTFEGGDPPSGQFDNVGVTYNNGGSFDVQLIVNNGICFDTLVKPDYIGVGFNPVADFDFTPSSGCVPLTVQFTDLSTVDSSSITQWSWEFVDAGSSGEQHPQAVFTGENTSLQEIELTVTSALGCTATAGANIPLLPVPEGTIEPVSTLCKGEPAMLYPHIQTDTAGLAYSWTTDPTLSCLDCLNPIITPQDTTTYELTVTNVLGCSSLLTVTVNVRPDTVPTITLTADTAICHNSVVQLQASGGDHADAYQWDTGSPGLSCYASCFNPVASPEDATTYYLTVTNSNGCSSMDSVAIGVIRNDLPFAGEDQVICRGDSVQLSLDFGSDAEWLVPDYLTCAYCPDPIAFPPVDMQYAVQAISNEGCRIVDTLLVEVMSIEDIDAGEDQIICQGESLTLNGQGEGTVLWSPSTGLSSPSEWQPIATPASTTEYIMQVERGLCQLEDTVTVEVETQTEIWGEDITICQGDTVLLEVEGAADTYQWDASPYLSGLSGEAVWAMPDQTTRFEVTGRLGSCLPDTANFTVTVNETPNIFTEDIRYFVPGDVVDLWVRSVGDTITALTYEWSPPEGLTCYMCDRPSVTPDSNMTYTVTATDDLTGCVAEREVDVLELYACPEELMGVPNVFSPNGDGVNDELKPILSPTIETMISFRVFDRWGAIVFETTDRNQGWDGTLKNREANNGVFVYVLEVICPLDGMVIRKWGDVTILR